MPIDKLPDDVLVEIFFYVNIRGYRDTDNPWHALVHVCRRWRNLVFASPRRLNLQLGYGGHRPISEALDAWPVLPVRLVSSMASELLRFEQQWDNLVVALESEYYNRICEIRIIINMPSSLWERFTAVMQKPFPELTDLTVLANGDDLVPVLPDSFLGGSAPRLRTLYLGCIPFPSIPKLLLSANGLVDLILGDIPDSGYISPDALATALAVMTRLESLHLGFRSPRFRPDPSSRPLPPHTRFILPALTRLVFRGVYEYLEDLLAQIDSPLLDDLRVRFFMDLYFDVPQLHRLIGLTEGFKALDHAKVLIFDNSIRLGLYPQTLDYGCQLELEIICKELDYQLSSLAQVCSRSFPLISTLEELEIKEYDYLESSHWKDDMENAQWTELLDPFAALKNLYLTHGIAERVCGALQELSGERATKVLPALRNLFVRGFESLRPVEEAMVPFVAARQLSGHPIVVDHWKR